MADRRGRLDSDPFSFTVHDDRVRISRGGSVVTVLGERASTRFLSAVEGTDESTQQQLMARATGNYKRGNERRGGRRHSR